MDREQERRENSFIRERVVKKNPTKTIILITLFVVILAVVSGALAAVSYQLTGKLLSDTSENRVETIVIARDDVVQTISESSVKPGDSVQISSGITGDRNDQKTEQSAVPEDDRVSGEGSGNFGQSSSGQDDQTGTGTSAETGHDGNDQADQEADGDKAGNDSSGKQDPEQGGQDHKDNDSINEQGGQDHKDNDSVKEQGGQNNENSGFGNESDDTGSQKDNASENADKENEEAASLAAIYSKVSGAFVSITVRDESRADIFESQLMEGATRFGIIIAESDEHLYVLTDGKGFGKTTNLKIDFNGDSVTVTPQSVEKFSNICVVRISKARVSCDYDVAVLGNSFNMKTADPVYMAGSMYLLPGGLDEGIITTINESDETVDGYRQLFYTDMTRLPGGSAVLLNKNSEVIGWVSDYASGDGMMAIAAGISPLKYIIEDLCSGLRTAYLGVNCIKVTKAMGKEYDLEPGLYVKAVEEESPAYIAGIQPGDRLISIDGESIGSSSDLQRKIDGYAVKSTIQLVHERMSTDGTVLLEETFSLDGR